MKNKKHWHGDSKVTFLLIYFIIEKCFFCVDDEEEFVIVLY